jgi:hypothetical protein
MSDGVDIIDVAADIEGGAAAISKLAGDPRLFAEAIKTFRAQDHEGWRRLLTKAELFIHCHRVCEWVVSRECVRICILLAGPPREAVTVEQIGPFTAVLARLAEQPKLIEALAKAVEAEDPKAFHAVVEQLKAQNFIHLLCHWVCFVRFHLVCRVLCDGIRWDQREFVAQLRSSAVAVAAIARKPDQLKLVVDNALTLNCGRLKEIFGPFQDCRLICFWICSWRCLVVCLRLTHSFPLVGDFSVEEMRGFAQFKGAMVRERGAGEALAGAVVRQDEKAFIEFVRIHKGERFAQQLCHWVCYLVCRRLCLCVCPPPELIPLFTSVGNYSVDPSDGHFAADGTTSVGNLAFTGAIPLNGLLPDSPAVDPIEYRFMVTKLPGGPPQPLTAAEIGGTVIGQLEFWEWDPTLLPAPGQWKVSWTNYVIDNSVLTHDIPQQVGPPLTVQISTPISPDGWVHVPSDNNLTHGGGGRFSFGHLLASLDTTKLTLEQFDLRGPGAGLPVIAGTTVPAGSRSSKPLFSIAFEARKAIGHASMGGNTLARIALSNTVYTYNYHPDWAGSPPAPPRTETMVASLDIAELIGHGCDPLTAGPDIHALFTAYHPYIGTCSVYLDGPVPLPPGVTPAPVNGEALSPAGGQPIATSGLNPCAYILWLSCSLRLTSGGGQLSIGGTDHIAFCVH